MNTAYPSAPSVLESQLTHHLLPPQQREGDDQSVAALQEQYLRHLTQDRLVQGGYIPNLVPILLWNRPSSGSRQASPAGPGAICPSSDPGSPSSRLRRPAEEVLTPAVAKTKSMPASRGFFRRGSLRSSVVNIAAAALGAGALSLPRAMYYSGILWGPLLMIVLAALSILSIRVIVQLVELSGKDSYEEIAKEAIGPWFALLVEVNIVLFCFGTAVAYMITVGQVLDATFGDAEPGSWLSSLTQSNTVLLWTTAFVLLPLSLLDSINDLRFASLAGVSCILYLILVVLYVFAKQSVSPTSPHCTQDFGMRAARQCAIVSARELWLGDVDSFTALQPKGGITGFIQSTSEGIPGRGVVARTEVKEPNVPSIYTEQRARQCIFFNYKSTKGRDFGLSLATELFCVAFFQLAMHCGSHEFAPILQGFALAVLIFIAGHVSGLAAGTLLPDGEKYLLAGNGGPGCLDRSTIPSDVTGTMIIQWEFVMTCMLVYSSLMCGLDTPASCGSFTPVVAGLAMVACSGSGGQYTGASLNPARVVGPLVVLGCGAQTVPLYLLGQFAGAILAVALVAATARTGPLNPQVSKPALGLSDREAWRLWLTGSPPSRLRGMNTETVETIHDYHLQLLHFHEGKPTEAFQRSSTSDLQRLFGVNAHACQRTSASASQIAEPGSLTEASREVALMLQHPEITLRETMPDTSPMDIFRSCTDEEVV
ncbi:AVT2 [Symbiodinium natans]|uniref:AVT2 protein n=1 Tax=Symbiodinium natans TaxID=878477 RepID=A0A812M665_9DINO|nr:AVT2 [Symbiodinium natans]